MKKARIFLPQLLLLLFGHLLCGCDNAAKEQAVAAALNQELGFLNDQQPTNEHQKLLWLRRGKCWNTGYNNLDRSVITETHSRLAEINKLYNQLNTLEKTIEARYATNPTAKLTLTPDDRKALATIEVQTQNLITLLELYPGPENFTGFQWLYYPPFRASKRDKRKNWAERYLENKPAYLAILHLDAFKAALQTQKEEIISISMSRFGGRSWRYSGRIFTDYRLLTDTLKPGEKGRAIVFPGSYSNAFSCSPFSNDYPKAFIFNTQKLPILQDEKTNDLVVKIKIPTTGAALQGKDTIKKNWSGKWVIGLNDGKDTVINISGSFLVVP